MSLRFSILASGSTGNATVVQSDEATLLIDAGLSARKINQLLEQKMTSCERLDGILITHEHADHIKGLGAVLRKYKIPVYANEKTWRAMEGKIGDYEPEQRKVFVSGERIDFGKLQVDTFELSHDAAEPVGFSFHYDEHKLSLVTDTGYVSPKVKEKVADSDVLILESNHDVEMLRVGKYPWNIKRRILGDMGHLSNEAAGEVLTDLLSVKTKRVYLAHLSRDHNMMDLARLTVNNTCEDRGVCLKDHRVRLMDTYYDRATSWDEVHQVML